jgi:hypothetical protein
MASLRFRTALALTRTVDPFGFSPLEVLVRRSGRSSGYAPQSSASGSSHRHALSRRRSPIRCARCPRDRQGEIKRDRNAVSECTPNRRIRDPYVRWCDREGR